MLFLRCSSFTSLVLLSFFQILVLGAPDAIDEDKFEIAARQQATTSCADYSMIANYSTIGTNSTFRAAFIQSSPKGTDATTATLDEATKQLPNLMFDKAINGQCGNLSALAIQEAPKNFSMGIVGPFTIKKTANSGVKVGSDGVFGTVVLVATIACAGLLL